MAVWDVTSDGWIKPQAMFDQLEDGITCCDFGEPGSALGNLVAAGTEFGNLAVWDSREEGANALFSRGAARGASSLCSVYLGCPDFIPNLGDSKIVALDTSGNLRIFDVRKNQDLLKIKIKLNQETQRGAFLDQSGHGQQFSPLSMYPLGAVINRAGLVAGASSQADVTDLASCCLVPFTASATAATPTQRNKRGSVGPGGFSSANKLALYDVVDNREVHGWHPFRLMRVSMFVFLVFSFCSRPWLFLYR